MYCNVKRYMKLGKGNSLTFLGNSLFCPQDESQIRRLASFGFKMQEVGGWGLGGAVFILS